MTLPPYTGIREGGEDKGQELGRGVSHGSHRARARPFSETRQSGEREGPATSAEGTGSTRIAWALSRGKAVTVFLPLVTLKGGKIWS